MAAGLTPPSPCTGSRFTSIFYNLKLVKGLNIDDSLDVFAAHGMAGLVGSVLTGILATDGGGVPQLIVQVKSSAIVVVYSCVVSFFLLKGLDFYMGLRVSEEDEEKGLDITQHDEPAYN